MKTLIMLSVRLLTFQTSFKSSFQTKKKISNFKFSNLLLSLYGTKDKVKRKERGMTRITV